MTTYVQDSEGRFIPASQRPDGTWRKARRVKDGYIPQEEVPLYESKGKQFMKKPSLPVGMCPIIAEQSKVKREKEKQKKEQQTTKTPGLLVIPKVDSGSSQPTKPKEAKQQKSATANGTSKKGGKANKAKDTSTKTASQTQASGHDTAAITEGISDLAVSSEEELAKKIKKLRKKMREIEKIEAKLSAGELKNPEQDQLDKVKRKNQILDELRELESEEAEQQQNQ